jgi:hypothetical protein
MTTFEDCAVSIAVIMFVELELSSPSLNIRIACRPPVCANFSVTL